MCILRPLYLSALLLFHPSVFGVSVRVGVKLLVGVQDGFRSEVLPREVLDGRPAAVSVEEVPGFPGVLSWVVTPEDQKNPS